MLQLEYAGHTQAGQSFDVRTQRGAFAGIISESFKTGTARVFFNMTATRGSARKFPSAAAALAYIYDRRVKKGWAV